MNSFREVLVNADIVIDLTYAANNYSLFMTNFQFSGNDESIFAFLRNKQVYRVDGTVNDVYAYDWFETAFPNAQLVLADIMVCLF